MNVGEEIIDRWAYARLLTTSFPMHQFKWFRMDSNFSIVGKDFGVTTKQDNEVQNRSFGLNGLQTGLEDLDDAVLKEHAVRVGKQAIELLFAEECH